MCTVIYRSSTSTKYDCIPLCRLEMFISTFNLLPHSEKPKKLILCSLLVRDCAGWSEHFFLFCLIVLYLWYKVYFLRISLDIYYETFKRTVLVMNRNIILIILSGLSIVSLDARTISFMLVCPCYLALRFLRKPTVIITFSVSSNVYLHIVWSLLGMSNALYTV